jgi:hypothetical protein
MKPGDLVKLIIGREYTRGIVLQLYPGTGMYTKVYWLSHKQYGSHPARTLEVLSENR